MNSIWTEETQPGDANFYKIPVPLPRSTPIQIPSCEKTDDQSAIVSAKGFYGMFKSACHGITVRAELEKLYNATYESFSSTENHRPEFSKVLFAMAHSLKVLRVINGGSIAWKAFSQRDDHRPGYDDRRPGYDDRRPGYDDRRPGYDDRRPGYDDRRPGYDNHHDRDNRRPHYEERRDDRR